MEKGRKPIAVCPVLCAAATFFAVCLPAATYEVGPGLSYTTLGAVPWYSLGSGDTVNIHYLAGGYHEIIMLSNSGSSNAPITLNGVPDPVTGALPIIDGANAVTATNVPWRSLFFNFEGSSSSVDRSTPPTVTFPRG
jgi:hypothetical protein